MAPQPGHTVDHTAEYEEFINKLREYHAKRGTNFEAEPKVGQTPVDLLKLFKTIVDNGGYDKISEEKLAWRNMVNALELFSSNEASAAYSLKLAYYKNLAAYEIKTIHNQEPPPPEILEHISAKGGGLLTRTLENFGGAQRTPRPSGVFDTPMDGSGDETHTPGRPAAAGIDNTPVSGRASRGLREAPPQRVIFQPDTGSTRQSRHAVANHLGGAGTPSHSGAAGTPQAFPMHGFQPNQGYQHPQQAQGSMQAPRSVSMIYNPPNTDTFSATVQAYEPRGPVPIVLQPVEAPVNTPIKYLQQQRMQRLAASGVDLGRFQKRPPIPPGYEGPNIYVRCLGALRSGVPAEEAFALSHLVKISYERGDKYKFESFPGLAEGLFDKALQVGSLFYHDVEWKVSYDLETDESDLGELDGVNGTPDILERIAQLRPRDAIDCIQTERFADQMVLITEAALTIRNMVTLPENAFFIADFPTCRDFLCIVLNLPNRDAVVELKHCALDIAEQVTPFLSLSDDDPLYQTLLQQLDSADRGVVLSALRAIGRISMNMTQMNRLGNVPPSVLQNVMSWLLLNDDELVDACLDFLYQYTAVSANVDRLLRSIRTEGLVSHLVRLLSHGAKRGHKELVLQAERRIPATENVLQPPPDLLARLVKTDEPERCYTWLRCFFEEDPDSSITQIAIWQAYQSSFLQPVQQSGRTMLGAAEFIRNVTHVYHAAGAQIQKEKDERGVEVQKFIIKGIRPRTRPISPEGQEFFRCQWKTATVVPAPSGPSGPTSVPAPAAPQRKVKQCGVFFGSAEDMYKHILADHLQEKLTAEGKVENKERELQCFWSGCYKYPKAEKTALVDFMKHVKTHVVKVEQDNRQGEQPKKKQDDPPASATAPTTSNGTANGSSTTAAEGSSSGDASQGGSSPSNPLKHQRQRSSVTNGDLIAAGSGQLANGQSGSGSGSGSSGGSSSSKRQKRSFVVPAKTISVAYEDTVTTRDERNPNLPPQAAGIPLSAVLVLRNIARNASKVEVVLDEHGQVVLQHEDEEQQGNQSQQAQEQAQGQQQQQPSLSKTLARSAAIKRGRALTSSAPGTPGTPAKHGRHTPAETAAAAAAQEGGGWNERLFRPMLPRLYEIMTENRALASYVTSLFQLIGEEP
ncbi:rsc complex subunit rsc9 [Ophiostoma piceae UAMH 11346]|uniref:Rsc complex subunit rsc9 n=1 Tax=Ophiostoma piceae (strain UAMH 11346) TaxID=1262450 RepID=S3BX03_OPHP1|nr:rsc complex subunit rsc9 [Ophiostoma piceae UAMH 11346]